MGDIAWIFAWLKDKMKDDKRQVWKYVVDIAALNQAQLLLRGKTKASNFKLI